MKVKKNSFFNSIIFKYFNILYFLDGNYLSFFGINSSFGEILIIKFLDWEIMNEIILVVEVIDVSKFEIILD